MTATQATAAAVPARRGLKPRHLWIVPGLAVAVYANTVAADHGLGIVPLLAFGILPHLAVFVGLGQPHAPGHLAPRAVPLFNAMHHPVVPLAIAATAATGLLPPLWLVGGLAWLGHVIVDWGFGDGQRAADGSRRRGLGRLIGVDVASFAAREER